VLLTPIDVLTWMFLWMSAAISSHFLDTSTGIYNRHPRPSASKLNSWPFPLKICFSCSLPHLKKWQLYLSIFSGPKPCIILDSDLFSTMH
jgi:hypothetical protein